MVDLLGMARMMGFVAKTCHLDSQLNVKKCYLLSCFNMVDMLGYAGICKICRDMGGNAGIF